MIDRIVQVVKKEFIQLRRDPRFLVLILFAPILQLILFGYVATTDVKEIPLAVYDTNRTKESRELIDRFTSSGHFELKEYITEYDDIDAALDNGRVDMVMVIPYDYARDLKKGKEASVQILVNGVNSNNASIAANYATNIILSMSEDIMIRKLGGLYSGSTSQLVQSRDRVWFNPELKSKNFMVPGIIAIILLIMLLPVMSMSIVREKEVGTIEQLNITPLSPLELIIGKVAPFIIIGYIDITLVTVVGTLWFSIPIQGSLLLLYLLSGIFIISCLSLGIFISSVSSNMIQAFMGSIVFLLPNILLSGFIFPINSMPKVFQYITYFIPLRYFLIIIRGIFLKGVGIIELWQDTLLLTIYALAVLLISSSFVARRTKTA